MGTRPGDGTPLRFRPADAASDPQSDRRRVVLFDVPRL
jgi:hypothetical protein